MGEVIEMTDNYTDQLYQDLRELQRLSGINNETLGGIALELIEVGHVNGRIIQMLDEHGRQLTRANG